MTRVIRTDSPARNREKLLKTLAGVLHYYEKEETTEEDQKDISVFVLLTLKVLAESIDRSASSWEKRDYWLKADRLRNAWKWTTNIYNDLSIALEANDLTSALQHVESLSNHLDSVALPRKQASSDLWKGTWDKWLKCQ